MDNTVTIKGNRNGIVLVLDADVSFSELKDTVRRKFSESAKFLGSAKTALSFDGRVLSAAEQKEILTIISECTDLDILCVFGNDEENERRFQTALDELQHRLSDTAGQIYRGALRSGQVLEAQTSVLILGNIEPGAKVYSEGNIAVIGTLAGEAYAGIGGNPASFVFATHMKPEFLQIGQVCWDPLQEDEKAKKKRLRAEKKQKIDRLSKVAYIEGEELVFLAVSEDTFAAETE